MSIGQHILIKWQRLNISKLFVFPGYTGKMAEVLKITQDD